MARKRKRATEYRAPKSAIGREISRAATQHWNGLNSVISRSKRKVTGPESPPKHVEVPANQPRNTEGVGGRTVKRRGRG